MTTVELLQAARGLIANPDRWTQGTSARDRDGEQIYKCDPRAFAWCAGGALGRYNGRPFGLRDSAYECLEYGAHTLGFSGVPDLNDTTDHPTVLKMFDLAIEKAREEEALPERDQGTGSSASSPSGAKATAPRSESVTA